MPLARSRPLWNLGAAPLRSAVLLHSDPDEECHRREEALVSVRRDQQQGIVGRAYLQQAGGREIIRGRVEHKELSGRSTSPEARG